jgi:hypothetical protein
VNTGLARAGTGDRCRIVACRDCCCGATATHPGVEHCQHVARLRALVDEGRAAVQMSGCLDNCERGNTIVVVHSRSGRAGGGRATWLGEMIDDTTMAALADWVSTGGPGYTDTPASLVDRVVGRGADRRAVPSDGR